MKRLNLLKIIMALVVALSILFIPLKAVFATETSGGTANVTINKYVWQDNAPADFQNTGETMVMPGTATALNGVEFTIYDVTNQYYTYMSGSDQKTAIAKIQSDSMTAAPVYATALYPPVTTSGNGQALFSNLPLKDTLSGKYRVYLFRETKTPDLYTITKLSIPLVLAMPIYKLDANNKPTDVLNTDIQLYPKNVTAKDVKQFTNLASFSQVTIGNQTFANVTTGDILNYSLTVNIPANIGDANAVNSFMITDKPDAGLALNGTAVTVGSLTAGSDYTIAFANGGFTVTLNLASANVQALAGKTLQLTYSMMLTATVDPDSLLKNHASVSLNNTPQQEITPPTPVGTGGFKFIKKDAQTGKVLAGAEFMVTNQDQTKFAKFAAQKNANGEYVFDQWVTVKADASTLVSDSLGQVKVIGLTNGTYVLNETKAPSVDYVKIADGSITFTVVHGQYATATAQDVPNSPKGLLPSTGGAGAFGFSILGALMMISALIWFRKTRKHA